MKKLYAILVFVALPLLASAQSRITAPSAIWPEVQASFGVGEEGIAFFQNQYRINTDARFNDLKKTGVLNFERVQLTLGYEHKFSEHWRGGLLLRYAMEDFPKILYPTAFLRHNGSIGSLYFNKQGMFEYVSQEQRDPFGRARLAVELGKRLPLKGKFLTPSINYEAFIITRFQQENRSTDERVIDRTRLRLSLNYELSEKLRINPYFMRQTDYYYVLVPPKYNENNQLVESGYTTKRNRISPVFGLEIKYNINLAPNTASITY